MAIEAGAVYLDVVFDEGRIKTQLVRAVDQAARAADGRLRQGLAGATGAAGDLTESLRASGAAAEETARKARASADRIKRELTAAAGGPEHLTDELRDAINASEQMARQAAVDAERIRRAMLRAGEGVDDLREDLDDAGRGAGDLGDEIDKIDWGSLAGAGALATLTVGMDNAVTSAGRLRAQMGLTAAESGDLEAVVRQVYGANFGESMGQASDAVVQVHQSLGLVDDDLSQAVQDIFAVSDAFDVAGADSQVLTEGLRAMQNLWPETDAAETLDLITASFQMGTGSAGDLQDTLTEYPRVFAEIGLSAGDMFSFLDLGMQSNAQNTDVLADSVKEMGLLVKEEGSTAQIAIRSIFPRSEAERLIDDFSRGGEAGREAFYDIIEGISGASSEGERFNRILEIFGGVGGDNAQVLASMFPELIANRDATREVADVTAGLGEQYIGLGATLGTFKRQLESALFEPLGQIAPAAGQFLLVGSSAATAAVTMVAAAGGMSAAWGKVTVAAVAAKTAILSVNTVAFLGAGVAIGFIVNELFKAKAAARELADELALAAGDDPADQLAAYSAELERQQGLRGDALTRINDAFFSPGETFAEIKAIEEMTDRIAVLRAEVIEAAYAGQTFSTQQDALNYYLGQGYDLTTALTAAQAEMVQLTGLASMGTDGWTQRLIAQQAASTDALSATDAFARGVQSAGTASMGAAIALHSATEATLAQQAAFDGVAEFFLGMVDPIGAYDAALAVNTEEMQAWAQGQADQTADASDSWADHATDINTTLADINQALLDQHAASVDWADNLQTVAARVPTEFLPELNRIATESPEILAAMVGATDAELAQFVGLATPAGTQFVDELELALAQMPEVGRRFGQETADGLTERLASGLSTAAEISHAYQRSLVTNINPLLLAIGRDEIPLAGINGPGGFVANTGGQVPGGYGSHDDVPATLTRGEVVQQVPAVRKWGPGNLLDLNDGRVPPGWVIPGYNAGGVVGPNVEKLHPEFVRRMQLWSAAQGQPYRFTSGWRSREQQQRLYEKYLNGTGNLAAPPGSSNHEFGLATDGVRWGGRNPGVFGLGYYVNGEPWHLEPTNARSMRGGGGGSAGAPAGASFLSLPPVPTHQFPTDLAVGAALTGSMQKGRDTAQAFIDEQFAFSSIDMTSGLPDQPGGQGSGVEQWTPQVLKALDVVGQPASYAGITKRRMKQESGGNPTVVNRWDSNWVKGTPSVGLMQVIGCVPLNADILTRDGWQSHDAVQVGDQTLGYNPETGMSEWTTVRKVLHYEDAEVWRIGNGQWSSEVTPDHRWWSDTLLTGEVNGPAVCPECGFKPIGQKRPATDEQAGRSVQVHRNKMHKVASRPGVRRDKLAGEFVRTEDFSSRHRLRVAAPAATEGIAALTCDEVRLIAWAIGDGNIHGRPEDSDFRVTIYQSKPRYVAVIQALLADVPHGVHVRQRAPHHFPAYSFGLRKAWAVDLFKRSRLFDLGHEGFVLALDAAQRAAYLDAMYQAEGHERDGFRRYAQNDGPVQDAIRLAVYLDGRRPTFARFTRTSERHKPGGHVGAARPHVAPSMFAEPEVLDRQPVWCVVTDLGTWTMRQHGTPILTGNSTYDAFKHSGYDVGPYSYGTSVNPLANILASMRYALSRYKSLPAAYNKSGGYNAGGLVGDGVHVRDRGGPLLPGLTWNGTGGAETVVDPSGPLDVNVIGWSSSIAAAPGNPLRAPEPNVRPFLPTPGVRPYDADMMINRLVEALEAGDPVGRLVDIVAGLTTSAAEAAGFVDGILGGLGPDSGVIAAVAAGATGVEGITAALAGIEQLQAGWEAEAEAVERAAAHTEAWGAIHAAEAALAAATTEEQAAAQERLSEAIVTVQDMDRVAALALEAAAIADVVTQLEAELAVAEEKAALDAQIAEDRAALDAEIAGNREALRVEGLTSSQRLVEVQAEMAGLEAEGLRHTDEWVGLLREAEGLQGDIADSAADVAAEIERQADAQREAAQEARQQAKEAREAARRAAEETAKSSRAEADRLRSELDALLDQRDRLEEQRTEAIRANGVAVIDAQTRAADDIAGLIAARTDVLLGAFGSLGTRWDAGWGNTVGQYADEEDRRIAAFNEWADGVADLRARGYGDLVDQMGFNDPSSLADVRLFIAATNTELDRLVDSRAAGAAQVALHVGSEADLLLGALGTSITTVRGTLRTTLTDLEADLAGQLSTIAAETALIGMDTGRSYVESITGALRSGLPGVIAAARRVQAALRDAHEAEAALEAITSVRPSVRPSVMPSIGVGAGAGRGHYVRGGGNYDTGGRVPPGDWLVRNATASDEWIFRDDQLQALVAGAGAPSPTMVEALPREVTLVVEGTRMRAFVEDTARGAIRQDTRTSAGQGRM